MNKNQRLGIARVLRAARPYIKKSMEAYVCHALVAARADGYPKWCFSHCYNARKVIESRLDGYMTVVDWLEARHPNPKRSVSFRNTRNYRLAWIDSMIQEFDPEGMTA